MWNTGFKGIRFPLEHEAENSMPHYGFQGEVSLTDRVPSHTFILKKPKEAGAFLGKGEQV